MSIDLHIHTTASDGDIDPVSVVRMAAQAGLKVIALADHETTSGISLARQESEKFGISLIPAVELLTYYKDKEIHLLGYFEDADNKYLQDQLAELRNNRTVCAMQSVKKLSEFGYRISWPDVARLAHQESPVSKGHIMQAVRNAGYVKSRPEAIDFLVKYLNHDGLAYVCHQFEFESAVSLIRDAGGIPVLAHPGLVRDDGIVDELCGKDIDGMEVFYHYFGPNREELVNNYRTKAGEKKLLKTGGSDYHGSYTPVILGENPVPEEEVAEFLKLFGL